ncbi:hypothetical protein SESBI_08022 [Sesbania bispinosa]|nr:hypothetical protein SESBI_08022 [Sesbania bispinosa]
MAHQEDTVERESIKETNEVADDVEGRVGRRRGRGVGVVVAAIPRRSGAMAW